MSHLPAAALAISLLCFPVAAQPIVRFGGETMRLQSATVTANGNGWNLGLVMDDDNGNRALPNSWRRWWHCQIDNLAPGGETLHVTVSNAGYSDVILPVWSLSTDGVTFAPYTRVPASATPQVSGSNHRFTLTTPGGVVAIRLAKYFPYTVSDKDAFLATIVGHPSGRVRTVTSLGSSWQGRPIELIELTNPTVPDTGKVRIWIHAGIHPAETTSYFVVEGLIGFLLSNDFEAGLILRNAIIDIVPMVNPDGVFLGNYRSNSRSANLEEQWAAPYNSGEREVVALRNRIVAYMGTSATPGSNPIQLLLNLHSSHNVAYPFHFRHTANANWSANNNVGVLPAVNALEGQWISAFRGRSAFVRRGSTSSSSCGAPVRPFVECMMHDRWSADAAWTGSPNFRAAVMAITYEGTYGRAADGITWNSDANYRQNGGELGRALADFFGWQISTSLSSYGAGCNTLAMTGAMSQSTATLFLSGGPANGVGWLAIGASRSNLPLPLSNCTLLTPPLALPPLNFSAGGWSSLSLTVPPIYGLLADMQGLSADLSGRTLLIDASNGIELQNQ